MNRHIVHKQKVTLITNRNSDLHSLQGKVSDLLQKDLQEGLQELFDRIAPPDRVVRLESVQLDLGPIAALNFGQEFSMRLLSRLEKVLTGDGSEGMGKSSVLRPAESLRDSFFYFLSHGRLPWYAAGKPMQVWEKEMQENFSDAEWSSLASWLKGHAGQPVIRQRLAFQFSNGFLAAVLEKASALKLPWERLFEDMLLVVETLTGQSPHQLRNDIWQGLLQGIRQEPAKSENLILEMLTRLLGPMAAPVSFSQIKKLDARIQTTAAQQAMSSLIQFLETNQAPDHPADLRSLVKEAGGERKEGKRGNNSGTLDEPLYVQNCGMVLLHPFLKIFYEEMGLLSQNRFLNKEAHMQAVLLLHYLATGAVEVPEYDLVLQKLLCGFPLEEPLGCHLQLTEHWQQACEKLLQSVIQYWPPLKSTSIEGLRHTFLQRQGKLSPSESGWRLTIEQKTVDILLGKLPWGYSTIRLPWMENILNVDWY